MFSFSTNVLRSPIAPFTSTIDIHSSIFAQYIIKWLGDSAHKKKCATDNYTENWDLLLPIWPLGICWIHKCNKIRFIEPIHFEIIPFRLSIGWVCVVGPIDVRRPRSYNDNLPAVYRLRYDASGTPCEPKNLMPLLNKYIFISRPIVVVGTQFQTHSEDTSNKCHLEGNCFRIKLSK